MNVSWWLAVVVIDFTENNSKRNSASFVFIVSITARIAESVSSQSWHYQTLDDQCYSSFKHFLQRLSGLKNC